MLKLKDRFARLGSVVTSRKWAQASAAAMALAMPLASDAADRDDGRFDRGGSYRRDDDNRSDWRHDEGHDNGRKVDVDIHLGGQRPQYETREVRVWVPPVYRTVTDRKWVEPVYRTEVERVWVPDRYEEREVEFRGGEGRWRTRVERVLVEPGHYESHEHRVCVTEGHWETCDRQELVSAGHYETRVERVPAPYRAVGGWKTWMEDRGWRMARATSPSSAFSGLNR
jgi:hypothetical protein